MMEASMRYCGNSTAWAAIDPIAGHDEILGESVKRARALDDRSSAEMHDPRRPPWAGPGIVVRVLTIAGSRCGIVILPTGGDYLAGRQ
jgi:hypothetical protein